MVVLYNRRWEEPHHIPVSKAMNKNCLTLKTHRRNVSVCDLVGSQLWLYTTAPQYQWNGSSADAQSEST